MAEPRFSPLAARNNYLPPRYLVAQVATDQALAWDCLAPVALLSDLQSETIPTAAPQLALAWDPEHLHLFARGTGAPYLTPELPAEHVDFWRQDHIEFRLQLGDRQVQFIVTADGRCTDTAGIAARQALAITGHLDHCGWQVQASIPRRELGLPTLAAGQEFGGQLSHTGWSGRQPRFAAFAGTELGYQQVERYGVFRLIAARQPRLYSIRLPEILVAGANPAEIQLVNCPPDATLTICTDPAGPVTTAAVAPAGSAQVTVPLTRPQLTHLAFSVNGTDLGAVSLRAAPPVAAATAPHPRLQFNGAALSRLLSEQSHPLFRVDPPARPADQAPDPTVFETYRFTANCGSWFRIAKESMLRRGADNQRPAEARIWRLLNERVQTALRELVASVQPTAAQLAIILPAFDELLRNPQLDDGSFAQCVLPPTGEALRQAHRQQPLTGVRLAKLNRQLLQSAIECLQVFGAKYIGHALTCFDRWLITREADLIDLATAWIESARHLYLPERHTHLHEGGMAAQLALAYDCWHAQLSPRQRQSWTGLADIFLQQYVESSREHAWTVTCVPNANAVSNGGCGLLALAWYDEHPLAAEALYRARKQIRIYLDYCSGSDGGNTEGLQYWQYGTENCVRFFEGVELAIGTDDGVFSHPALTRAMNNVRVSLCNDGCLHGVNDTIPMPVGMGLAWFFASRYDDAFARWYGDHAWRTYQALQQAGRPAPYRAASALEWLWRGDHPEVSDARQPPLPTCLRLDDIQYGIVRSDHNYDCLWTAGLKGARPPYTHHNQADAGACWVDYAGERLLLDPGYYKGAAEDHCLPLIDGVGPLPAAAYDAEIYVCEETEHWRYLAVDAASAYRGAAKRVRRHLVLLRDAIVLVDDVVVPSSAPGRICAQYQAGGPTDLLTESRFGITGRHVKLQLQLSPGGQLDLRPERSLNDTHWGYHFADCRLFPVHYHYRCGPPLLTVISDSARPAPTAELSESGLRLTRGGEVLTIPLYGM